MEDKCVRPSFTVEADSIVRGSEAYALSVKRLLREIDLIDYEMVEIDYAFYSPACVVVYVARLRGVRASGASFEIKLRVLDIYARQDGGWHQVSGSISLHPDALAIPGIIEILLASSRN